MQSTSSLYSLSSCSPILLVRHYIQDCHVQKVTAHAGVLLSNATALSSPRSPDVVLGERVLCILIFMPGMSYNTFDSLSVYVWNNRRYAKHHPDGLYKTGESFAPFDRACKKKLCQRKFQASCMK